jgi:long-chain fatty acid transport protein
LRQLLFGVVAITATGAVAGGIDRSGQPVTLIFQDGDYAEVGFGYRMPDIRGTDEFGTASGDVAGDISEISLGLKKDLGPRWSAALIVDQPWGANIGYPGGSFAYAGTFADSWSLGLTGLLRYRIDERFSVLGGVRATSLDGQVGLNGAAFGHFAGYNWDGARDWGYGYVAGAAYEIPEIALRVALTYSSETRHDLESTEVFPAGVGGLTFRSETEVTMPQSVNLDFQTGVTPDTLVYGSVRWVNWAGWEVAPPGLQEATGMPLVSFSNDTYTYRLGVGRQLTERVSAAVEVSHETAKNDDKSALDPYDGYTALAIGGTYAMPTGLELTGGISYAFLGDAPDVVENGVRANFEDNRSLSVAFRIGYRF